MSTVGLENGSLQTLPQRVVEAARRLAGGSVGLYLTDVAGSCLLRVAGDGELPERLAAEGAVGPEFDADGIRLLCDQLDARWPGGTIEPLWVLGRALGVLISSAPPAEELAQLTRAAGPLFELATGFTDVFERGRRREQPSAAAEMQLELLPPRIAKVAGGRVVASVLPAYDVGGDWFDHADNPEGVWLAIADSMGKGTLAAAMSAVSIGAFRSARRQGESVGRCCQQMHHAVEALGLHAFVTALVGLWEPQTATFTFANCGHLNPLIARAGRVDELVGERTYPLGIVEHDRTFPTSTASLRSGDRLLLYSDGIVEARLGDGTRFGVERLETLLSGTAHAAPSVSVAAIERDVLAATAGDVRDDATQMLLAVD